MEADKPLDKTGEILTPSRKPGPVPGVPTRKYNVMLEESLAEWAKVQPGGLSEMVRRLLNEERQRRASDQTSL